MVLVTLPAIDGLKPAWREASSNLGGTTWTYWRRVGLPVLTPSMLGGFLLLFANAFSAYATVYALNTQANVLPVKISFGLRNDVGGRHAAPYALATWMIIVIAITMAGYSCCASEPNGGKRMRPGAVDAVRRPPLRGARESVARLGPNLVLVGAAIFFIAPLLSTRPLRRSRRCRCRCSAGTRCSTSGRSTALADLPRGQLLADAADSASSWRSAPWCITLALLVPTALYVHLGCRGPARSSSS